MRKRGVILAALLLFITVMSYSAPMVEILNQQINETAKKGNPDEIWKTVKFILPDTAPTKITIVASAKDNGVKNDDDLKFVLDKDDFGWATDKAWSGRELRGKQKAVIIEKVLKQGEHRIDFYADVEPTLFFVKVETEKVKKDRPNTPVLKDGTYIDKIGAKISWSEVEGAKSYEVMRAPVNGEFDRIAQVSTSVYLDVSVAEGSTYRYKIVAVGEGGKSDLSEEIKLSITEKVPPAVPTGLKSMSNVDKLVFVWDRVKDSDLAGYTIYRRLDTEKEMKKVAVVQKNEFEDTKAEIGKKYVYAVSAFDTNGNDSANSAEFSLSLKSSKFMPEGVVDIDPKEIFPGDKVTVYFSAKKSSEIRRFRQREIRKNPNYPLLPQKIFIHIGYNSWTPAYTTDESQDPPMIYDEELEYYKWVIEIPPYAKDLNLAFYDEDKNWDKNYSKDYIFKIQKDNVPPKAPTITKITPMNGVNFIEFTPPADKDIEYYMVFRSPDPNLGFQNPDNKLVDNYKELWFRDAKAKPNTKYYYRIQGVDFSGNMGKMSDAVEGVALNVGPIINSSCVFDPAQPSVGVSLRIYYSSTLGELTNAAKVSAKVGINNWDTAAKQIETAEMKYDKMFDAWYHDYVIPDNATMVNVSFTDGAKWDTNKGANWSVRVTPDTTPPAKVKGFSAEPGVKMATLKWQANIEKDLDGYIIYKDGKQLNSKPIKGTTYKDENLDENYEYRYRIAAVDMAKNESEKDEITVKPLRDAIIVPEGVNYSASISDAAPIKLVAFLDAVSKWQLEIINPEGKTVRTFAGRSYSVSVSWDLKDEEGKLVTPGSYKYKVTIIGAKDIMPKEAPIAITE